MKYGLLPRTVPLLLVLPALAPPFFDGESGEVFSSVALGIADCVDKWLGIIGVEGDLTRRML